MPDIFSTPDDTGENIRASDLHSSLGEQLFAEAKNSLDPKDWLSGAGIARAVRMGSAAGFAAHDWDGLPGAAGLQLHEMEEQARAAIPSVSKYAAQQRIKEAGLDGHVNLPAQDQIKQPVLDLMIQEGHERRDREAAIARGPQGFYPDALGAITSIGAGMIDPVNIAAFSIPVVGEARWGKLVESAGESIMNRAALNAGRGAAQGIAGTAALQPAEWWLRTRDGEDYTFTEALKQVALGGAMGGAAHAGFGAFGDVRARRRGLRLPGSPADLMARGELAGVHVPGEALGEEGATADLIAEILGHSSVPPRGEPVHPAELYADLPPAAQDDALRVTMADMINGQLPKPMEMLQVAADHSPRIAESLDAWHGSPHDIERFESSKIGTGEGAQVYGHGLYFAENESVARDYQRSVSDKDFIRKAQELYGEFDDPADAHDAIRASQDFTPGQKRLLLALEKDDWLGFEYPHQAVSAALSKHGPDNWDMSPETLEAIKGVGHVYKVRIGRPEDHFLDWDKPLADQSAHTRAALKKLGVDETVAANGEDAYRQLAQERVRYGEPDANGMRRSLGPQDASAALQDAGLAGIKYLDHGSRKAGEGTRNFVVFDDKHVEITHKNGEPVSREDFAASRTMRKVPRGRAAADPQTWSLFEFLAREGGLKPDPELEAIFGNAKGPFVPSFGALVRPGGRTLDNALRLAKDHGYFFDAADVTGDAAHLTPRDLLDRLAEESAGRRQYRHDQALSTKREDTGAAEREKHEIIQHLHEELEASSGQRHTAIDPRLEDRVVEMMTREGERDVLDAYERAIMEDQERYDAEAGGQIRDQQVHSGHEVSDDAGGAPAGSRAATGTGPRAGSAGSGASADAGGGPRAAGRGDRTPAQAQLETLARDQAFARLGDRLPAYDDPAEVENSRWADNLPEPASVDPKRSAAALHQAVAEAEQIWRDLEPYLSEEERRVFNDALDTADRDAAANAQVLKDGAACLAAAIGEGAV